MAERVVSPGVFTNEGGPSDLFTTSASGIIYG